MNNKFLASLFFVLSLIFVVTAEAQVRSREEANEADPDWQPNRRGGTDEILGEPNREPLEQVHPVAAEGDDNQAGLDPEAPEALGAGAFRLADPEIAAVLAQMHALPQGTSSLYCGPYRSFPGPL